MRSKYFSTTTPIHKECFGQAQESHQREATIALYLNWRHLLDDNAFDHVVYLKVKLLSHTVLSTTTNGEICTIMIYPWLKSSVLAFDWIAHFIMILFKQGFPRVLITWRTDPVRISNVKSLIPTDLRAVKWVVWNIMRMHLIMYSIRLLCTTAV